MMTLQDDSYVNLCEAIGEALEAGIPEEEISTLVKNIAAKYQRQ